MTWAQAFRRQAESEYGVYKWLSEKESALPTCHRLHALQMATEKLAKSYMAGSDDVVPKKSHAVFEGFLRLIASNRDIRKRFGYEGRHEQFKATVYALLPFARKVQSLAPSGELDQMNAEYPWQNAQQKVVCPADYGFPEFTKSELIRLATFIDRFFAVIP